MYVDKTNHSSDADLHKIADLLAPALTQDPTDLFTRLKEAAGQNIASPPALTTPPLPGSAN